MSYADNWEDMRACVRLTREIFAQPALDWRSLAASVVRLFARARAVMETSIGLSPTGGYASRTKARVARNRQDYSLLL